MIRKSYTEEYKLEKYDLTKRGHHILFSGSKNQGSITDNKLPSTAFNEHELDSDNDPMDIADENFHLNKSNHHIR